MSEKLWTVTYTTSTRPEAYSDVVPADTAEKAKSMVERTGVCTVREVTRMKLPSAHITICQPDETFQFALGGDDDVLGRYPDEENWILCDEYGQEFPETYSAIKALLVALRAERTVLGDTGYTCDQLGFSLNEHALLEGWVLEKKPGPGEYIVGETSYLLSLEPTVAIVHDDLYITRASSE